MKQSIKISPGWIEAPLRKLATYIQRGKSPKYADYSDLPVVNQKCVRWNGVNYDFVKYIHPDQSPKWAKERFLQCKDLLWNSTGTGTIGRACLFKHSGTPTVADSHITIVRAHQGCLLPEYLHYFVMSPFVQKQINEMQNGSTNQVELSKGTVEEMRLPVAPLAEQKRIIDKIARLFSYLDEGERLLEQVKKQISTYRQAVLKAAVTGELTKEWRVANGGKIESGEKLLQRILEERRKSWQGRGKYEEPLTPDTNSLPELPDGWVWSSLGALLTDDPQNGVYFPKKSYGSGCPIIRIDDFQIDWARPYEELQQVIAPPTDCTRYALNKGDFIVNRVNSLSHLGKSMRITSSHAGALFESNIMRFAVTSQIEQTYLELYLKSVIGRRRLTKNCKHAVNQASINQQDVMSTPVPLPSKDEQAHIVKKIKSNLDTSNKIDEFLTNHLRMSSRLRQSILKSAFSGELVGQDPNDEPASELLGRIHEEKKQAKASNPRSGRTTKRSVSI